jgi:mono/diheme cytochrome c family protein
VLPGYGFPASDGGEPVKTGEPSLQPTSATPTSASTAPAGSGATASGGGRALGTDESIALGEQIYRARCSGCHQASGGANKELFRTTLPPSRFKETVMNGRAGTTMPAFGALFSSDEIWAVFEFLLSRDKLQ